MILNIYRILGFDLTSFKTQTDKINILNENSFQIDGIINLENFSNKFFINFKSNLLFIISEKNAQLKKVVRYLNSILPYKLSYFAPNADEEHDFLCSSNVDYLKFIHDNKIVDNDLLTKKYCEMELDEDYYFFEAKIKLENIPGCYFLYYGDVIKIKDKFAQYLTDIIKFFVKFWMVK